MENEVEQFSPKTIAGGSAGSLHAEYSRCNKPTCRCRNGARHGPYFRRYWREGGRTRSEYVPLAQVPAVLDACARYRAQHPSQREMLRMLREQTRLIDELIIAARASGADDPTTPLTPLHYEEVTR
jgi:hypothetical protein